MGQLAKRTGRLLRQVNNEPVTASPGSRQVPDSRVQRDLDASPESTPPASQEQPESSPPCVVSEVISQSVQHVTRSRRPGFRDRDGLKGPEAEKSSKREPVTGDKRRIDGCKKTGRGPESSSHDEEFFQLSQKRRTGFGKGSQVRVQLSQSGSQTKNIHGKAATQQPVLELPEMYISPARKCESACASARPFEEGADSIVAQPCSQIETTFSPRRHGSSKPAFSSPDIADGVNARRRRVLDLDAIEIPSLSPHGTSSYESNSPAGADGKTNNELVRYDGIIDLEHCAGDGELDLRAANSPIAEGYIRCPLCESHVELKQITVANSFDFGSFREQRAFCDAHQRWKAASQWESRQYPTIDWSKLPTRLDSLRRDISSIIERRQSSRFQDAYEDWLDANKSRRNTEGVQGATSPVQRPGYYGRRGATVIMDYMMREHGDRIRRQAVKDRLLQLSGISAYIQAVLVPEVACRLVQVDMKVSEVRAREILEESADIGELLNEEEEDSMVPLDNSAVAAT